MPRPESGKPPARVRRSVHAVTTPADAPRPLMGGKLSESAPPSNPLFSWEPIRADGQQAKVAKRSEAVAERRRLAEASQFQAPTDQLKPLLVKIEALRADMSRLRDLVKQGQIHASVSGRLGATDQHEIGPPRRHLPSPYLETSVLP